MKVSMNENAGESSQITERVWLLKYKVGPENARTFQLNFCSKCIGLSKMYNCIILMRSIASETLFD
ncbi:hypothetical protein BWI96_20115 [Siphonobacter sp. SORGH_AS_0500]|nr:hypothetical protein BWI96_20115 [Siphonobacter sp. SORGH_AS_0500]